MSFMSKCLHTAHKDKLLDFEKYDEPCADCLNKPAIYARCKRRPYIGKLSYYMNPGSHVNNAMPDVFPKALTSQSS